MTTVYVIMGVAGCGKTTIGQALANELDCAFYDGDDFHPSENVAKMAQGIPLNDTDRAPWLARLAALITDHLTKGITAVIACSALKKAYRDQLHVADQVQFVYLQGNFDLIWKRIRQRQNHYMKADMLRSQFDTLEPPTASEAIIIPIALSIEEIITRIINQQGKKQHV